MERNDKTWKVVVRTARPGLVIGRQGEGSQKIKREIQSKLARWKIPTPRDFRFEVEEVRSPESNAAIVGQMVAEGLEKRMPFKRVIKQMVEKVMANRDVKGVRIMISGRLGGADMSRSEQVRAGNIPLQTLRADVDFAKEKAYLPYGVIGIQVWIYKGEVFAEKQQPKQVQRPLAPAPRIARPA
jgi:small subunit ribosomal protein S3